jgi:hypothetical protein
MKNNPLTIESFMKTKIIVTLSSYPNKEIEFNNNILWTDLERVQSAKRLMKEKFMNEDGYDQDYIWSVIDECFNIPDGNN